MCESTSTIGNDGIGGRWRHKKLGDQEPANDQGVLLGLDDVVEEPVTKIYLGPASVLNTREAFVKNRIEAVATEGATWVDVVAHTE